MIVDRTTACTVLLALGATVFAKENDTKKKNLRGLFIKNSTDIIPVTTPVIQATPAVAHGGNGNPELNSGLFEGDIVPTYDWIMRNYGKEVVKELQENGILSKTETSGNHTGSRGLGTNPGILWNTRVNGVVQVPYAFVSGHFTTSEALNIANWISQMTRNSGVVNFIPRTSQSNYVRIRDGEGCSSFVGMIGGPQDLTLSRSGCGFPGTSQHEFLHALGFSHEQSRPDRDRFVRVNRNNIEPGKESNFEKRTSINSLGSTYDYGSLMHYKSYNFSFNGQPTIEPLQSGATIGQRNGPSTSDVIQMRLLYQCQSGPRTMDEYNANRCTADCQCWEGASGCGTNDNACQGDLMCRNNMCTFGAGGCQDNPIGWYDSDGPDFDCNWYGSVSSHCVDYGDNYANNGATANEACCVCGGGSSDSTYVSFRNGAHPNKCLDVKYADTTDGNLVWIYECNGTPAQEFRLDEDGYIRSALDENKCIVPQGDANNNDQLLIYTCNPDFTYNKWNHNSDGTIRPKADSNKCVDVRNDDETTVHIYECNDGLDKVWTMAGV